MISPNLRLAYEAVLAKKGIDPVVLETAGLTPVTDYFLICCGQTTTQIKAIADNLQEEMDNAGAGPCRREGLEAAGWILLDYGWLVVHIMLQSLREFYQLERLWHDAARLEINVGQEKSRVKV
jgi:ribosome-associated protein